MNKLASAALTCILLVAPVLSAGPEVPFSNATRQRAALRQRSPQIATDGTNFLVAWHDERMPEAHVYVTRLGPDGKPLDAGPIRLPAAGIELSGAYAVTWTGNVYLVLWTDWERRTLQWVRVDRDGRVLDAQPRSIAGVTTPHDVASVNGRTLLVFTGEWPESPLYGQLIEADGTAAGARLTFPHAGRSDWIPAVATNGDAFYVAWTRFWGSKVDVVGVPVALDGQLGAERTFGQTSGDLYLASNGTSYLLAYSTANASIVTEQLDPSGATLVKTVHPTTGQTFAGVTLAAYGSGYLLVTREAGNAEARILDAAGRETGRLPLDASSTFYMSMAIASHPTATLAVWYEDFDHLLSGSEVFAEPVDGKRDRVLLSEAAARQSALRVASNGTGFLGAWIETRERPELRAGRVSASGMPLDGEGILIGEHVTEPPALTFDGQNYVLAWIEDHPATGCAVRVTRLTHEGLNLDGGKVVARACAAAIGLGSNGRESLLVRNTRETDPVTFRVVAKLLAERLQRDLTVDATVELPSGGVRGLDLAVGSMTGMWLVAWTRYTDNDDCGICDPPSAPTWNVDAARLSHDMALLDARALHLAATQTDRAPSIAAAGDEFLVAWSRQADQTVRARRVPRFGPLSDELLVSTGRAPSVLARAGAFVIAFEEDGNLFSTTLGTPGRSVIAATGDAEHSVRLVVSAGGVAAAYLRTASEPLYNFVDRGFLRTLDGLARRRAVRK